MSNALNFSEKTTSQKTKKTLRFGLGLWRVHRFQHELKWEINRDGLLNALLSRYGRERMKMAALHLKPIATKESGEQIDIHFLTGERYWYQTAFCAYSLAQHSDVNIRPVVYDDGTLSQKYAGNLLRIFPNLKIVSVRDIEERLDEHLPHEKFPFLRQTRTHYFHLRKLTDIHAGARGWNMVFDSDMLFHRRPAFLLDWLQSPRKSFYILDIANAYEYSDALLTSLVKTVMPSCVNVGVCGLNSENIDWEQLESWGQSLVEAEGYNFFLEQALTAMYLAGKSCDVAPRDDYVVLPTREEAENPRAALHHYVADSKAWYFRFCWKHITRFSQ
jgi:rhodanese-related sulfurtransferase